MLSVVNVQVRGCEVDDELRAHFEEKLHSLERLWSRLDDAEIRIGLERGRHCVEVTLHAGGLVTRAEECQHDCRAAFDAAVHKLAAQLKRYKEKVQFGARRQNNRDDVAGTVQHPKGHIFPASGSNGYHENGNGALNGVSFKSSLATDVVPPNEIPGPEADGGMAGFAGARQAVRLETDVG